MVITKWTNMCFDCIKPKNFPGNQRISVLLWKWKVSILVES